jgi:predicted glycosyltransferase
MKPLKILVDITHPGHVHFFRPAMKIWQGKGYKLLVVARDKDVTLQLLDAYGYDYLCLSKARKGLVGLGRELLEHEGKLFRLIQRERPDILLEIAGTFIVHAGFLTRTPSLVFYDTEHARLSNSITYPFATKVITPDCYTKDEGKKHIRYAGYHELAYLHPKYFTPDPAILTVAGFTPNDRLFLLRFVSWHASHDIGHKGFSITGKRELVNRLNDLGRVIITSEAPLPPEFEPYRMQVSPSRIHDLLYYCALYIGEGGTMASMASEAAVLGVPSIFVSSLSAGSFEELKGRYGLLHPIDDEQEALDFAVKLATEEDVRTEYRQRRQRLLEDKIDVTAWLVDFVEQELKARPIHG